MAKAESVSKRQKRTEVLYIVQQRDNGTKFWADVADFDSHRDCEKWLKSNAKAGETYRYIRQFGPVMVASVETKQVVTFNGES